jgi:hypothetical protein
MSPLEYLQVNHTSSSSSSTSQRVASEIGSSQQPVFLWQGQHEITKAPVAEQQQQQ